jgi:hypothetical protein
MCESMRVWGVILRPPLELDPHTVRYVLGKPDHTSSKKEEKGLLALMN